MSADRPRAPRGTRDVLPGEGRLRRRIVGAARTLFERYGYAPIITPTFEETEVFARGVGSSTDIVRKEMYTFTDQGGRELTLRPEGTAPIARAYVEHGMHKLQLPIKLWYLAPMFRQEAPQKGRFREHYQLGAEALGSASPLVDIESIALLADLYGRLGVPEVRLRLSSMGDPESRAAHRELLVPYLESNAARLPAEARERMSDNPLRLFDSASSEVAAVMADAPLLGDHLSSAAAEHQSAVLAGLEALGITYELDPTLVRGMDYYTLTVFEFTCDRLGAQSGIGGGGRYDGLVEQLGGEPTPGVGFGTGVERIGLALEGVEVEQASIDAYVAILDDELRIELLPLIAELRAAGVSLETDLRGRGLRAMMRHAAALGAARVAIIGRRDFDEGMATVRDMESGEQTTVPLDELPEALR